MKIINGDLRNWPIIEYSPKPNEFIFCERINTERTRVLALLSETGLLIKIRYENVLI